MSSTSYLVSGMTCEHCVRAVTEELTRLPDVGEVSVELVPDGHTTVTVGAWTPLSNSVVSAALDEAGPYELVGR